MKSFILGLFLLAGCATVQEEELVGTPTEFVLIRVRNNSVERAVVSYINPDLRLGQAGSMMPKTAMRMPRSLIREGVLRLTVTKFGGYTYTLPEITITSKDWCYDVVVEDHPQFNSIQRCR